MEYPLEDANWEEWLNRLDCIRVWARGAQRAPHKPLLLLFALGKLQQTGVCQQFLYKDVEGELQTLLDDFGPPNPSKPIYPFNHLTSDGLWEVHSDFGRGSVRDSATELRNHNARGALNQNFARALLARPERITLAAHMLLDRHFPPSIHEDICGQVGLDLGNTLNGAVAMGTAAPPEARKRSSTFREEVLMAYERACAICGFDAMLGPGSPGLEAAHVQWFNSEGPDEISNGLCLCSLHHKLLDSGVMGITSEYTVQVSARFVARSLTASSMVISLAGAPIAEPQSGFPHVRSEHIDWHDKEVFRSPSRRPAA